MPQPYERAVLTNQGEKLLAKAAAGQGQIEYVCMAVGCGVYDVPEKECDVLKGREALKEEKNRYAFSCMNLEDKVVRLTALLTNQDPVTSAGLVTEGYYINEVGIFAKEKGTDNSTAILYSMCVTASNTGMGDYMPEYNGRNRSEITQDYILSVDDSVEIYVNMIGAVALAEDVEHYKNDMRHHVADLDNPHHTDKTQVGLGRVDNTSDMEKPVSTSQQEAIDGAYQQATGYTDQKIADLINGAPGDLDTLGEIAEAMRDNDDVMAALNQAIGSKASEADFSGHAGNNTIHITASERQSWNDKQTTTGDTKDNTVSFTSGDSANPTGWADVGLIASGEKHSSLWQKCSLFAKNVRYLWKLLGSTSLSGIGDGTVTGAISSLNTGLTDVVPKNVQEYVADHKSELKGDTGATGPQGQKGDKGDKGDTGATGPQGPSGNPWGGGTFTGDVNIKGQMTIGNGGYRFKCDNYQSLYIFPHETEYALFLGVWNIWTLCPATSGSLTLGTSYTRWGQPYFTASPNINSDRNLKKDITPISDKYLEFFALLQPVTYRFKDGSSGRIHVGFISQDVETAMEQSGLSDLDFAGFCRDKIDDDYIYSLRYEEFIALNTAVIQHLQKKVGNLEQRLERLEKLIAL